MVLSLAIDYGGREELEATRAIAQKVADGKLGSGEINEENIVGESKYHGMPDPDLVIRTSGEIRVSNFLLWQIAYAELLFTDVLWPDFTADQFEICLDDFSARQRRFGATAEQVENARRQNLPDASNPYFSAMVFAPALLWVVYVGGLTSSWSALVLSLLMLWELLSMSPVSGTSPAALGYIPMVTGATAASILGFIGPQNRLDFDFAGWCLGHLGRFVGPS